MSEPNHREERVAQGVRAIAPPGEREALDRAIALAAETAAGSAPRRHRPRKRFAAALAAAATGILAALVLSPAGAAVRDWIGDAVDGTPAPNRTTIGHIPGGGELVVQSADGPWVVREDGSRRLLGDYEAASWSPRGLYLAVSRGRTLTAVEPDGDPRWSIEAPAPVRDPRWSTSGQRVVYRSGGDLRLVAGDGIDDRVLAAGVAPVAPAWMPVPEGPYSANVLAFVDGRGRVRTMDADSGKVLTTTAMREMPRSIGWLDRGRVLAAGSHELRVIDARSGDGSSVPFAPTGSISGVAASPAYSIAGVAISPGVPQVAVLVKRASAGGGPPRASLHVLGIEPGSVRDEELFTGLGRFQPPLFSPDGTHVLLGWRDADQWLFLDASGSGPRSKPLAIGDVSRQFDPGAPRRQAEFPSVAGWCCS